MSDRSVRHPRGALRVSILVPVLAVALAGAAGEWALGAGSSHVAPAVFTGGDTQVVYGPTSFSTPNGSSTNHVERFSVVVQPGRRYTLQLTNGGLTGGSVVLNGTTVATASDLTAPNASKSIEALSEDTIQVTVQGSAGASTTVSLLADPDPTFNVYGPETFTRTSGTPVTETRTFSISGTAAAPYFLHLVNGNNDGSQRISSGTITLNGVTVVSGSDLSPHVGSLVKQVSLSSQNTLTVTLAAQPNGFLSLRITATDTTPPTITINAPAPGLITRDTTVAVSGTVQDETPTTVAVNGQPASMNGTSFTATAHLTAEGASAIQIVATDAAGHSTDSTRTVIRDTQQPVLTVNAPANNAVTKQTSITVSGTVTDQTAVTVNANGVPLPVDGSGSFTGSVPLNEGANVLTVTATDAAGNQSVVVRSVTRDTQAPVLAVTAPLDGAVINADHVTVTGTVSDATAVTVTANGTSLTVTNGSFSGDVPLSAGPNTIAVTATDAATNSTTVSVSVTRQTSNLPPDPSTVATAINPTVPTNIAASTAFLYSGSNPIQTGVSAGTISPLRAAVIRGKALTRDGQVLPGVTVSILGHPEFGQTLSRTDGMFDLAVNGGSILTVSYDKTGLLSAQRQVNVPWRDYVFAPDAALIPIDTLVTAIDFTQPIEVARGSMVTDTDGTRQTTLFFSQGTQATLVMPGGSTQPLSSMHVRATEYTVGPNGPTAMPAPLPPASAYTYAVELSVDEAQAAGASSVQFDRPVAFYVENFLHFPTGRHIPVGFYDRTAGSWIPMTDGRVLKVLSTDSALAQLDLDGTGQEASDSALNSLGITTAERTQLAETYSAGEDLWRMQTTHFSPIDGNHPDGPAPNTNPQPPKQPDPKEGQGQNKPQDKPCNQSGASVIECENQALREDIPLVGTALGLHYTSLRAPGRVAARQLHIPLTGDSVPLGLKRVKLEVLIAGQDFKQDFDPAPNQNYTFTWDGKDGYGRPVQGAQLARVVITNQFPALYAVPPDQAKSFGLPCFGNASQPGLVDCLVDSVSTRAAAGGIAKTEEHDVLLGGLTGGDIGGWTVTSHHAYDPVAGVLYFGDGTRATAAPLGQIGTFAGAGGDGFAGDGGPATSAQFEGPNGVRAAPDGSLYIADSFNDRIRRVGTDGIITTVAGNGTAGSVGDGGLAVNAELNAPADVAVSTDGSFYISEFNGNRIRRVAPDGTITTIAGTGAAGFSGDGGPATSAKLNNPYGLAIGPDGSLYIADNGNRRVRRVDPNGGIATVAGAGGFGFNGDSMLAVQADLNQPSGIAVSPDGRLYIADAGNNRVRLVTPDGLLRTVAGGASLPNTSFSGDGGDAKQAILSFPIGVALDRNGRLFIADFNNSRVRMVGLDGVINTVVGDGDFRISGDGNAPTGAGIDPGAVSVAPDGSLYIGDIANERVRIVKPSLPAAQVGELLVASPDGREAYRFDADGRHSATLDTRTGAVLTRFGYDSSGRLLSIADLDSLVTTVDRAAGGEPIAIVTPYGQRTTIQTGADSMLSTIANPAGDQVTLTYHPGGLLATLADPRGQLHRFTFDSVGQLSRDEDPAGGSFDLARVLGDSVTTSTLTTRLGRSRVVEVRTLSDGTTRRKIVGPDGLTTTVTTGTDGSTTVLTADGTTRTATTSGDPRFGMQTPSLKSLTISLPSGLTTKAAEVRTTVLSNPADPLALASDVDSLNTNGNWTVTQYLAATRTLIQTSPEGRQVVSTIDTAGRAVTSHLAGLDSVQMVYDSKGRLQQYRTGKQSWTLAYDTLGRLLTTIDPLGRRDTMFYDAADRPIRRVLPNGSVVQFTYDSSGNGTSVTPPGRPAHNFRFTAVDLVAEDDPPAVNGATPTQYFYNADRQLDSLVRPDSIVIRFRHDSLGRLDRLSFDRGTSIFRYSPTSGLLATIQSPTGDSLAYFYDGSIPTGIEWFGTVAGSVAVTYNSNLRVATQTVNGANAVSYSYDRDGLLRTAGALRIGLNSLNGLPSADTLGEVVTSYSHDHHGDLSAYHTSSGTLALSGTAYTRDSLSRITQLFDTTQGDFSRWSYVYDSVGQLLADSLNGVLYHLFTYDRNGNRLTLTSSNGTVNYAYDDQDRLLSAGTTSYTYGSNGELRTRTVQGEGTSVFTYDGLGNLVAVALPDGTHIDYVIDGQNRRVGRKVNGVLTQAWIYQNQLNPVAELDASGNVVSRFVYGTRQNVPDYVVKNGTAYRIVTDQVGSVRLVVDSATGAVVQRIDYDEWGQVTQNTNPGFQPFAFAGGLFDDQTLLTRFGSRDYDAVVGRWVSRDPISFRGGSANLYEYALGDPINSIDPSGESIFSDILNYFRCPTGKSCLSAIGTAGLGLLGSPLDIFKGFKLLSRSGEFARIAERKILEMEWRASHEEWELAEGLAKAGTRFEGGAASTALQGAWDVSRGAIGTGSSVSGAEEQPLLVAIAELVPGLGNVIDFVDAARTCVPGFQSWLTGTLP